MKFNAAIVSKYLDLLIVIELIVLFFALPFEKDFNSLFLAAQVVVVVAVAAKIIIENQKNFIIKVVIQYMLALAGIAATSWVFRPSSAWFIFTTFIREFGAGLFLLFVLLNHDYHWLTEGKLPKWLKALVYYSLLAFLIIVLLTSIFSTYPALSLELIRKELGAYVLIFLSLLYYVDSQKRLKRIVLAIYLVGLLIALLGIGEWLLYKTGNYTIKRSLLSNEVVRELSIGSSPSIQILYPFGHHNRMASFLLVMATTVLLQYYLAIKRTTRHWIEFSFFFPLAGIILTVNRAALIALFFSLCLFFLLTHRRNLLLIPIVLISIYVLSSPQAKERYLRTFKKSTYEKEKLHLTTIGTRIQVYCRSLKILQDHWLLGIGYGWENFELLQKKYKSTSNNYDFSHSHNNFLEIAVETGVLGLLSFVLFNFSLFILLWKNYFKHPPDSRIRRMTAGFIAILTAIFIFGLSNFSLRYSMGMLIWSMFALTMAFIKLSEQIEYE